MCHGNYILRYIPRARNFNEKSDNSFNVKFKQVFFNNKACHKNCPPVI
jgi:hypothetical protein